MTLLKLEECADRTSTTIRWWRRAVFEGRIPVVKLGHLVRVDEADLAAFLQAHRHEGRPAVLAANRPPAPKRTTPGLHPTPSRSLPPLEKVLIDDAHDTQ